MNRGSHKLVVIVIWFTAMFFWSCSDQNEDILYGGDPRPAWENDVTNGDSYLALGDSYTVGESVITRDNFPHQLVYELNGAGVKVKLPDIVARTGWTSADLLFAVKRISAVERYDMITLCVGVNDQYTGVSATVFRENFRDLLDEAIKRVNNNAGKVIVLSIPDYSITPFARYYDRDKIRTELELLNGIIRWETALRRAVYVDVVELSRKAESSPDWLAPDGLHPSAIMYKAWVKELLPQAEKILDK